MDTAFAHVEEERIALMESSRRESQDVVGFAWQWADAAVPRISEFDELQGCKRADLA